MLMEVKNQIKVTFLSIKYALLREMLNKFTFLSNVIFMILNNASWIIQWIVLYNINDNIGGYTFKMLLLLWGLASLTYGVSHFFFKGAYNLSDLIVNGSLDNYLVQPKNVLISVITSSITVSAIGDIIYGYIMLFIYGFNIKKFILFTIFGISGGLILTSLTIIFNSLSFFINRSDIIAERVNSLMTNFATYPDGIFKGIVKFILYTVIPVGLSSYIPVSLICKFDIKLFMLVIVFTVIMIVLSFVIFYKGLKKYSSSNLMNVRV